MAGDMATWLVARSHMHPAFSSLPVMYGMSMGGYDDPTTRNTASRFEHLILQLQTAAYDQAKRLIRQRKAAIELLAQELTRDPQETVQGQRIIEIIETTPVAEPELSPSNGAWSEMQQPTADAEVSASRKSFHVCNSLTGLCSRHAVACKGFSFLCMYAQRQLDQRSLVKKCVNLLSKLEESDCLIAGKPSISMSQCS